MDQHQGEEIVAHEEEIMEEAQMHEGDGEYYEEEYIEVDEGGGQGGQIIDSKGHIYVEGGDEEIVGELDPGTYIGVDGGTVMASGDQQYLEEEGQLGDGQIVRVMRPNTRQQHQYPVHYIEHQGVAYPARRIRHGYGAPTNRQYHVQQISQNSSGHGRMGQVRQPQHNAGYQQHYPVKRQPFGQYGERGEYTLSPGMGSSDGKLKGYYDHELQEIKPSQVLRPANALLNISNSSMGSPLLSTLPFQRAGSLNSSAGAPGRDPLTGSILSAYLGGSATKTKPRKSSSKKKPCNCTKSMCLKLYCDCFANGEFCLDCNCKECHNNLDHEAERSRAIKSSLERNPSAFKPKIGVASKAGRTADMERLHQKGCHCKKSNCLKAKVPCTDRCKCCSCKNTEHDRHHKFKDRFSTGAGGLAQLAAVAAADARSSSPFSDDESDACGVQSDIPNPKTQPWFYMTEDVIEATTMCLVAQAQEMEEKELSEEMLETSVLREFGRCLEQIIENANSCQSTVR